MEDYRLDQSGQEVQNILDGAAMQVDLTAETERATEAEQTLQDNIDAEATRAQGAEGTLQDNIDAEEARAEGAESTLQGNIDAEETRAKSAEKQNADDIDSIEEKIPSGASSSNKLATEEYVNDSVATATATFRGTYNVVTDLSLLPSATHSQISASLKTEIATADSNDYAFVLIPTSVETSEEIEKIERYKYNGSVWGFEYVLNNSGFTAAQWAAINSGITSNAVGKLDALPNSAELTILLNGKQDTLTFDNVPTQGSSNPVKSGGVYSAIKSEETRAMAAESQNANGINALNALVPAGATSENKLATIGDVDEVSSAIESILLLIPSAASALNQLADKAFVNSSIATATATFRGTYNLVTDLSLNVNATHSQIAGALGINISTADNNDYAFVQIPTSIETPTEIRVTERYKFNGTAWAFEYDLNNSGFTSAQWAAINSGITIALVGKLNGLPTNAELTTLLNGKQDTLTFDNVPTQGSDNPVKSSGIYNVIKAITDLIPAEATAQNQLADKADVAAKIVAAIPSWKGQYDALTDLQAVTGVKAGDMGCVKTTDSDGHAVLTFYQYSAQGAWVVYYVLRHYAQNKPATTGTTGDYLYNGMGRIELQKNILNGVNTLTQAMLTQQNTIYVIQYDFTLGENITVPANCVLEFDGGSVSGAYTLTGANTGIQAGLIKIFNIDVTLAGTFANGEFNAEWFGANHTALNNDVFINNAISKLNAIGGGTLLINRDITISDTIWLMSGVSIKGVGTKKRETAAWLNASPQIKCAFSDNNKWMISVMPNEGVTIPYNALDIATYSTHDLRGIKIENLTLIKVSSTGEYSYNDEAIFGGIRVNYFRGGANLKNVEIIGVKYGLSLSYSHSADIEMVIIEATACDIFIGATVTVLTFKNCWFKSMASDYQNDWFDFSIAGIECPPYLQTSDIKVLGICGKSGSSGTGAAFYGCEFEGLDAVGFLMYGQWLFDGIYFEAIAKTVIYGFYAARIWITKQLCEQFDGVSASNGYEFGGRKASFTIDGTFPKCRCYIQDNIEDESNFLIVGNAQTSQLCYYDSGTERNPNKKFLVAPNTIYARYTNSNANNLGVSYNFAVPFNEVAKRVNTVIEGKYASLIVEDSYESPGDDIIVDKYLIMYPSLNASNNTHMNCWSIKNTTVSIKQDSGFIEIRSGVALFKVFGKCIINNPTVYPDSNRYLVELAGDEEVNCIINARAYDTYMDGYAIKNRDFPYPYKVIVNYDDGITQNTHVYTNTSRPTKGVPIGYVYIENSKPIYYTGSGWVDATGATV